MRNAEVAEQFEELADRLLLEGESWFKVAAYRRAAATFRGLSGDLDQLTATGNLEDLPGVGDAIATKVRAFLTTGHIPLLERLRQAQPPGLLPLLRETGLAPRSVRALAGPQLQIDSTERLAEALKNGSVERAHGLDRAALDKARAWLAERSA